MHSLSKVPLPLAAGWRLLLLTLAGPVALASQSAPPAHPVVLPLADEMRLALEALPAEMREGAGVWVLTAAGARQHRATVNGYTCIVNRDEVEALKPTCYDPEGTATILPVVVRFSELLMQGVPVPEIRRQISAGFRSGKFISPRRAGIAFMLSTHVVNVLDPVARRFGTAPPHYMIYAPNVTNADLSIPDSAYAVHDWMPSVAYTGPQGFIIVSVPHRHGTDGSMMVGD